MLLGVGFPHAFLSDGEAGSRLGPAGLCAERCALVQRLLTFATEEKSSRDIVSTEIQRAAAWRYCAALLPSVVAAG